MKCKNCENEVIVKVFAVADVLRIITKEVIMHLKNFLKRIEKLSVQNAIQYLLEINPIENFALKIVIKHIEINMILDTTNID